MKSPINLTDYKIARPWLRLALGLIFDLRFDYSKNIQEAYLRADMHLTEFEQFPGSIDRSLESEVREARERSKR